MLAEPRVWAAGLRALHVIVGVLCMTFAVAAWAAEPPTTRLVGTVLAADGKPAAKARVGIVMDAASSQMRSPHWPALHVETDAKGSFDLAVPRSLRTATVVARRAGAVTAISARITLTGARQQVPTLKLAPGLKLAGRVLDERGAPVVGVAVESVSQGSRDTTIPAEFTRSRAASGRDGSFELPGLDIGVLNIRAYSRNHALWRRYEHRLDASAASRRLDITLKAGVFFSGTVVDVAGRPLVGAKVSDAHLRSPLGVTSDARGGFRLGPFDAGTPQTIEFALAGYTPYREYAEPRSGLIVVLNRTAALRGRVVDAATQQPLRSFQISVHSPAADRGEFNNRNQRRQVDSPDGRFELPNLYAGTWTISVLARGYPPWQSKDFEFQGSVTHDLIVAMNKGLALRGRVFDQASGKPLAGAQVSYEVGDGRYGSSLDVELGAAPPPQVCDAKGAFELVGLPPGPLTIRASMPGYRVITQKANAQVQSIIELAAVRGASIRGQVVAADGKTPLQAMVLLKEGGSTTGFSSDAEGRFEFSPLSAGRYGVEATTDTGRSEVRDVTVAEGQGVTGLTLRVTRAASVRGQISGLSAAELGRVSIEATDFAVEQFEEIFTLSFNGSPGVVDAAGAYRAEGLAGGRAVIAVHSPQGSIMKRIEVAEPGTTSLDFDFADVKLSGQVTRNGRPVPAQTVFAKPLDGQSTFALARTTASGAYSLSELAPGRYSVGAYGVRPVEVRVGTNVVQNFELAPFDLAGRAIDAATGQGLAGVTFDLVSLAPSAKGGRFGGMGLQTDRQGAFSIREIEAGDYLLVLTRAGYDIAEQRVAVTASVEGLVVAMRPAEGVRLRVRTRGIDEELRSVYLTEPDGKPGSLGLFVRLDADGEGRLQPGLTGRTFRIQAPGMAAVLIERWNGAPLEVELLRSAPSR